MKTNRLSLLCLVVAALVVTPAAAEVFTIKMTNGSEFITRYQPRQDARETGQVALLTEYGNWISLLKSEIADITSETESRGFGTVLDTNTIIIGWAPNDKPVPTDEATDPTTKLLNYLQGRDSQEQDFSVRQFVNIEDAGAGGLPARGASSSGSSSFPIAVGGTIANEPSVIDQ